MASAASGAEARRADGCAPPSRSSSSTKNSNGGARSAAMRQRFSVSAAACKARGRRARARAAPTTACPRRPARAPAGRRRRGRTAAIFSTAASARSSSGKHQEIAERHQVLHGDLVGEPQAVGAGDRDAARLQGRDHQRRERDGACAPGSGCRRRASARSSERKHLADCRASRRWCRRCASASRAAGGTRRSSSSGDHGSASARGLGLLGRPDLDQPAMAGAVRGVADAISPAAVSPGVRAGSAKMRSTASSTGATVRNDSVSGTRCQRQPRRSRELGEARAHVGEHFGAAPWKP